MIIQAEYETSAADNKFLISKIASIYISDILQKAYNKDVKVKGKYSGNDIYTFEVDGIDGINKKEIENIVLSSVKSLKNLEVEKMIEEIQKQEEKKSTILSIQNSLQKYGTSIKKYLDYLFSDIVIKEVDNEILTRRYVNFLYEHGFEDVRRLKGSQLKQELENRGIKPGDIPMNIDDEKEYVVSFKAPNFRKQFAKGLSTEPSFTRTINVIALVSAIGFYSIGRLSADLLEKLLEGIYKKVYEFFLKFLKGLKGKNENEEEDNSVKFGRKMTKEELIEFLQASGIENPELVADIIDKNISQQNTDIDNILQQIKEVLPKPEEKNQLYTAIPRL